MRESIGGAWLFGVVVVFIFLFAGFLAYSVSYTRAFNVKNEIINYIEEAEGFSKYNGKDIENEEDESKLLSSAEGKAYYIVNKSGYDWEANLKSKCPITNKTTYNKHGVCIEKVCPTAKSSATHKKAYVHYKVTTFMTFGIPIFNIKITIPISGETRTITDDRSGYACVD